jgi:hypothetical protein
MKRFAKIALGALAIAGAATAITAAPADARVVVGFGIGPTYYAPPPPVYPYRSYDCYYYGYCGYPAYPAYPAYYGGYYGPPAVSLGFGFGGGWHGGHWGGWHGGWHHR